MSEPRTEQEFKLFLKAETTANLACQAGNLAKTRVVVSTSIAPGSPPRISASFIFAHPADYPGRPTLHYQVQEWRLLLQELKDLGVDTVILEAAAWVELEECYYPSAYFKSFKQWDVLEPLLRAVTHEDLAVFVGGEASRADPFSPASLETRLACFSELLAYRSAVHGLYVQLPDNFMGNGSPQNTRLNGWLAGLCAGIKKLAPEMPILMAPAINFSTAEADSANDELRALFNNVPVDILAPHDSIGTNLTSLPDLKPALEVWQHLSRDLGAGLWVTVEPFELPTGPDSANPLTAGFNRLRFQLEHAGNAGEKTAGWDLPYFFSRFAGQAGLSLRKEYSENIDLGFVDK